MAPLTKLVALVLNRGYPIHSFDTSSSLQVAVVIMGFLLHGDTVSRYGKEAYQQRPVYGINQQA